MTAHKRERANELAEPTQHGLAVEDQADRRVAERRFDATRRAPDVVEDQLAHGRSGDRADHLHDHVHHRLVGLDLASRPQARGDRGVEMTARGPAERLNQHHQRERVQQPDHREGAARERQSETMVRRARGDPDVDADDQRDEQHEQERAHQLGDVGVQATLFHDASSAMFVRRFRTRSQMRLSTSAQAVLRAAALQSPRAGQSIQRGEQRPSRGTTERKGTKTT